MRYWLHSFLFTFLIGGHSWACAAEPYPYRNAPIRYFEDDLDDPVSKLVHQIELGKVQLEFDAERPMGYLKSLLSALEVSPTSQMLVFAKNSVHARLINPSNPRALYFNDNVYVGYVPGAPILEISSVDSRRGGVFYTLAQKPGERGPRFAREESCLLCHASSSIQQVPGHLVRSFLTDADGNPTRGSSRVTHSTPYPQRWGGFYVTGDLGNLPHMGNLSTAAALLTYDRNKEGPGQTADSLARQVDSSKYFNLHSDAVALLVHEHQTHGHNLITRVGYEHLFDRSEESRRQSIEDLVKYFLFIDEPELDNPILGSAAFENWFTKQGASDDHGRSLREFDLETRLFRYRLSYLIDTAAFDNLPNVARKQIFERIYAILSAEVPEQPFDKLPRSERRAIIEIVKATKSRLPLVWKTLE